MIQIDKKWLIWGDLTPSLFLVAVDVSNTTHLNAFDYDEWHQVVIEQGRA